MEKKLFDPNARPIITPEAVYGAKEDHADICLVILSHEIYAHILSSFDCRKVGMLNSCCGPSTLHVFDYKGMRIAFFQAYMGSAVSSMQVIEANWQTGAEKFIMFGSAGALDEEATRGRYVVPVEAFRGEGTSQYYAEPAEYIDIPGAAAVAACFDKHGIPYVKGRVWTTDSMYRETEELCAALREDGCIAVEMELAGVQAVCSFHGFELYDFLETGDILDGEEYDLGTLASANHDVRKFEIALKLAEYI